jgi:fermentation-respiration switch protein FrsA (DUF1100 family)
MWKMVGRWGITLGIIYTLGCVALYILQARFIFAPEATITETPRRYGLPYEEVWLSGVEGSNPRDRLHGWWIPAKSPSANALLYLHGNGINIGANAAQAGRFHKLGLSVFLFDYRGYGQSTGPFPSERAVYADAQRAWNYVVQERRMAPRNVILYGHSLGGAIAIDLALKQPDAGALMVQSSFTSALEMSQRTKWVGVFPVGLLLNQRFASIEKVPQLQMPTLYLHGQADSEIPFTMSQRLYAATQAPKRIQLFPKANHNNVAEVGGELYFKTVGDFLKQVPSPKSPATLTVQ